MSTSGAKFQLDKTAPNSQQYYELAYNFLKDHGQTLNFSYKDKVLLLSLNKRIRRGVFSEEKSDKIGFFDYLGHDIKSQWMALGEIPLEDAHIDYANILLAKSDKFSEEIQNLKKDASGGESFETFDVDQSWFSEFSDAEINDTKESLITSTMKQYREYALQVYPHEENKQNSLINQLQSQHFNQIMETKLKEKVSGQMKTNLEINQNFPAQNNSATLEKAETWLKEDVVEFISSTQPKQICLLPGTRVIIRFFVSENACFLRWSIATVKYDIKFGVYFAPKEESGLPEDGSGEIVADGESVYEVVGLRKWRSSEFIVCGEHKIMGRRESKSNYLIVFDNTYSLWNSKTIRFSVEFI